MSTDHACNLCGGLLAPWLFMPIDAKKDEPTPHSSVLRCQSCALGVVSPLPDPDAVPALYDLGTYYTHGQSHMPAVRQTLADRILTKVAWWADGSEDFRPGKIARLLPAKADVCDVGCGDAQYLRAFSDLGCNVTGVDPDPSARSQAEQAGIHVLDGTAENIPDAIRDARYDLVLMTHALEHCRDVTKAMQGVYGLTRPGGYCYVEVPNCASEHFKTFTICSEMFDAPRHLYFFTPANLQRLAERVGFTSVRTFHSGYVRNFAPSWRAWEAEIARRVHSFDRRLAPKRHTLAASTALFLRSFWRKPDEKFDSIGLLVARATSMDRSAQP
jgi:SAM-dependent methyltransferase